MSYKHASNNLVTSYSQQYALCKPFIKCDAAFTLTGAIRGTTTGKLYQEVSLECWWFNKLYLFVKHIRTNDLLVHII